MRSAGCIVNDISDKEFDKNVERTKSRPIASNKVSIKLAIFYTVLLCLLAFLVLINFNNLTIILALGSMPLAFTYPLMKRFTYWPQLFLGITFNYGLILGWTTVMNEISIVPIIFYMGAIFWTLGYDTMYGFQDIKDDEIIGVKSTSIKFKNKPKNFVATCYVFLVSSILISGILMDYNYFFYISLLITIMHLFFYQIKSFNSKDPTSCLNVFKSNNLTGLIIFCNILIGKI
jgi:4-hydroxybenzoate polyprenyltransferase